MNTAMYKWAVCSWLMLFALHGKMPSYCCYRIIKKNSVVILKIRFCYVLISKIIFFLGFAFLPLLLMLPNDHCKCSTLLNQWSESAMPPAPVLNLPLTKAKHAMLPIFNDSGMYRFLSLTFSLNAFNKYGLNDLVCLVIFQY